MRRLIGLPSREIRLNLVCVPFFSYLKGNPQGVGEGSAIGLLAGVACFSERLLEVEVLIGQTLECDRVSVMPTNRECLRTLNLTRVHSLVLPPN